jgi:hypothetical protein
METREYHRIFLEAFPDWDVCPDCEQLYKKSEFRTCNGCVKSLCVNCKRGHEVNVEQCKEFVIKQQENA